MRGRRVPPRGGRAGGSGLQPGPRGDWPCWATLGEPSLPLPQLPGSAERGSGGGRSAGLLWAWGAQVPAARPALTGGEVLRGRITSVQGLLSKVGMFTCSRYLLSSLMSWIC